MKPVQRRQRPFHARPKIADADTDLAARRSRKKLTQGDEVGIAVLGHPPAPFNEFRTKIAKVRDRAAERGEPQTQENEEHAPRGAALEIAS